MHMDILHTIHSAIDLLPMANIPDPGDGQQPPGFEKFTTVMGWVKWVALGVCVIALIVAGARMAISSRRGEGGEHATSIAVVLVAVIVISGAASILGFLIS